MAEDKTKTVKTEEAPAEKDFAAIIAELQARLVDAEAAIQRNSGTLEQVGPARKMVPVQWDTPNKNIVSGYVFEDEIGKYTDLKLGFKVTGEAFEVVA